MMRTAVLLDLVLDVIMNDCKQFLYPKSNTKVLWVTSPFKGIKGPQGLDWNEVLVPFGMSLPFLYENEGVGHCSGVRERFATGYSSIYACESTLRLHLRLQRYSKTQRMEQWRWIWLV